jgi:Trk-type K+ transport system membrane component
MDCETVSLLTGSVAVLGVLLPIVGVWIGQGSKRTSLPEGFKTAGLALQFAGNGSDIAKVIGESDGPFRSELITRTKKDFVLLVVYTLFLVSLAFILCHLNNATAPWLTTVAAVCSLTAGLADLTENRRLIKVFGTRVEQITDEMAQGIRRASLVKWLTYFIAIGLLGLMLLLSPDTIYRLVGVVFVVNSAIGLVGLRKYSLLPLAVLLTGILSFVIGILLFIRPEALGAIC